ncbi:MAG: hypothetical protein U1G08_00365 [Verrucomicrobiota bacterium]
MSFKPQFRRTHLWVLLGFFAFFAWVSVRAQWAVTPGDGTRAEAHGWRTLQLMFAGPLAGGIVRNGQACCRACSLALLPYCGAGLALGNLFQFIPLPAGKGWGRLRMAFWVLGLVAWFGGAILSYGHALD